MPRPGPRPYECVRKAWHSERHQPIRGSLIQEIFRVVNEVHGSATKKNKEWQEKLPIVVLKAEEIMYSKANSEAEYMDLKTLWERTNDAINTIIRRDESTEKGKLLQPCIEAALNLGCTPRRASRSQRNSNPRCYLTSRTQEAAGVSPGAAGNSHQGNDTAYSKYMSHSPNFVKPIMIPSSCPVAKTNDCETNKGPFASESVLPPMENNPGSKFHSVYPLYYGNRCQFEERRPGFGTSKLIYNASEPARKGGENLSCRNGNASDEKMETNTRRTSEKTVNSGCDLSLRLGPVPVTCPSAGKSKLQEVKSGSSPNCQSTPPDKTFSSFPRGNVSGPSESCSRKWSFEDKYRNEEATMRKRKAVFSHPLVEDQQFFWLRKLPGDPLTGGVKNAGL